MLLLLDGNNDQLWLIYLSCTSVYPRQTSVLWRIGTNLCRYTLSSLSQCCSHTWTVQENILTLPVFGIYLGTKLKTKQTKKNCFTSLSKTHGKSDVNTVMMQIIQQEYMFQNETFLPGLSYIVHSSHFCSRTSIHFLYLFFFPIHWIYNSIISITELIIRMYRNL